MYLFSDCRPNCYRCLWSGVLESVIQQLAYCELHQFSIEGNGRHILIYLHYQKSPLHCRFQLLNGVGNQLVH